MSGSVVTVLVSISTLTVSGAVFADSPPQTTEAFTTHHSTVLQAKHTTLTPSDLPVLHHYISPKHPTNSSTVGPTSPPTQPASTPTQQVATTSGNNPTTEGSSSTSTQSTQTTAQPVTLQLAPTQTTCTQGQTTYTVATATLTASTPFDEGDTITWNWETRIDSGTTPTTPPISSTSQSQAVTTGGPSVTLAATDQTQPLLSTSSNSNYAYSFRLVISGPVSVTSSWVSVPASTTSCKEQ